MRRDVVCGGSDGSLRKVRGAESDWAVIAQVSDLPISFICNRQY